MPGSEPGEFGVPEAAGVVEVHRFAGAVRDLSRRAEVLEETDVALRAQGLGPAGVRVASGAAYVPNRDTTTSWEVGSV